MERRLCHVWDMGLLHRYFHARGAGAGEQFASLVCSRRKQADYQVCAMDCEGPTFRHELFPSYKHRERDPAERLAIHNEILIASESMKSCGVKVLQVVSYEADDIIATVAKRAVAAGFDVQIFSGDKDLAQLLTEHVRLNDLRHDVTSDTIRQRFGVDPSRLRDYLSIVGDTSDNVPGVSGAGPKAACALLSVYHSLDAALEAATRSQFEPAPMRSALAKLNKQREQALLSRRLITLCDTVPI